MNEMRKLMEAVANPPQKQKLTEASAKIWMYGDFDFDKVSGPIPVTFIEKWVDAVEANDQEAMNKLEKTLEKKTSRSFARIFTTVLQFRNEIAEYRQMIQTGHGALGEAETVAGFGPTKAAAKKAWDTMQDNYDNEQDDWDY